MNFFAKLSNIGYLSTIQGLKISVASNYDSNIKSTNLIEFFKNCTDLEIDGITNFFNGFSD